MPRSRKELFSVSHSLLYTSEPDRESTFHLDLVYMFFFTVMLSTVFGLLQNTCQKLQTNNNQ